MTVVSPSQSNPGDQVTANAINAPVNQIAAVINGGIDATNITPASIGNTQVAAAGLYTSKVFNPYKFSAYRNASLNSANSTSTALVYDAVVYDTGANYSTSNGRFTAPVAGFYQFSSSVQVGEAGGGGHRIFSSIYKNGTELFRSSDFTNPGTVNGVGLNSQLVVPPIQLAASDYIQVFVYTSGILAYTVGSAPMYTYFGGYLLSAT